MGPRLVSLLGLVVFLGIAWGLSENRRRVSWRIVWVGLALQVLFGLLVLRTPFGEAFFAGVRDLFTLITDASNAGSSFVFGALTEVFVIEADALADRDEPLLVNAVVAFQVLPVVIVVATLAAILYHLHVIQALVRAMAWLMRGTLKTSGAETFATALLVFLGIEAMPTVKGYLQAMTRSELCTLMTAFMATVAANVLLIYASFGAEPGHLLAASIMSAPAAILVAKLMVPETELAATAGGAAKAAPVESYNVMDAAARGASEGVMLAINIGALLIAFISLIYLLNAATAAIFGVTFTEIMGWIFTPFAWLMGVPLEDTVAVGQLLGTKTVVNEFIAYTDMQALIAAGELQPRSVTIATYALCGFANPGSLGILLAGLIGLAPERRRDITQLGLKCFVGGTLAVFMTACVAGLIA